MELLFGFSGRIGRLQWWLGQLVILIILIAGCVALAMVVGTSGGEPRTSEEFMRNISGSAIVMLLAIFAIMTWINIAVTVKRFHDRDKSGWWFCIVFVPYIGALWQIVECGFLAGTRSGNRFGPSSDGTSGFNPDDAIESHISMLRAERSRIEGGGKPVQTFEPAKAVSAPTVGRRPTGPTGFGRRGL